MKFEELEAQYEEKIKASAIEGGYGFKIPAEQIISFKEFVEKLRAKITKELYKVELGEVLSEDELNTFISEYEYDFFTHKHRNKSVRERNKSCPYACFIFDEKNDFSNYVEVLNKEDAEELIADLSQLTQKAEAEIEAEKAKAEIEAETNTKADTNTKTDTDNVVKDVNDKNGLSIKSQAELIVDAFIAMVDAMPEADAMTEKSAEKINDDTSADENETSADNEYKTSANDNKTSDNKISADDNKTSADNGHKTSADESQRENKTSADENNSKNQLFFVIAPLSWTLYKINDKLQSLSLEVVEEIENALSAFYDLRDFTRKIPQILGFPKNELDSVIEAIREEPIAEGKHISLEILHHNLLDSFKTKLHDLESLLVSTRSQLGLDESEWE